ncbi:MAG: type I 3-dehydroquinate dehydratase [Bacteriovoracia bacterium]
MTYVCVTGNEQSPAALEQRLERVLSSHPRVLCELRLDFLDLTPAAAFGFLARIPVEMTTRLILTQRLKASGALASGNCGWDALTWQSWWQDVMAFRPWYGVDLDWLVLDSLTGESLAWHGGKFRAKHAFFSLHASIGELEQMLPNITATAREHQAGVKLAAPVESAADLARLANIAAELKNLPFRIVVAMGEAGRAWRWSGLAGNVTYFAAEGGRATAPGQEPFAAVLPYLSSKQRPDVYLLLGDNPDNKYGEERWNRAFLQRGARNRYINSFSLDRPGPEWAANVEHWLSAAGVKGASVTKPYKLSFPEPTNTLKRAEAGWSRANFDGAAVVEILARYAIKKGSVVVIAGGGGAAQAVAQGLREHGFEPQLWVRREGRLAARPEGDVFVSTWPGEYQEALVDALGPNANFRLVIDAQFSRPVTQAPLARWAQERGISYVPGTVWWKEQARLQDVFWFGADRLGAAHAAVLRTVPSSKSETLRALAIALAFGVPTEIRSPGINDDTEFFAAAIENLGGSIDRNNDVWRIFPAAKLSAPAAPIMMGEGATGLRMLAALSPLFGESALRIDAAPSLRARPMDEIYDGLGLPNSGDWPMTIPSGTHLPETVSLERSSQFASGFLIAGAAQVFRGLRDGYRLRFTGERRSETYLHLTLAFLRETGLEIFSEENVVEIRRGNPKARLQFAIERDASAVALLEVYARRWRLKSFFSEESSRQGDAAFPELLAQALETGEVSLRHHPDLAPALWAGAALLRKPLLIRDCPQLHLKESDRAKLLVLAARALGAPAEEKADGFYADFSQFVPPARETFLRTEGDHRLAMAFGLVATDYPQLAPDRRDCVRKSFPQFWQALALLEEALPG